MKPPVYQKLFDKAAAATTSVVELYNEPGFGNRDWLPCFRFCEILEG